MSDRYSRTLAVLESTAFSAVKVRDEHGQLKRVISVKQLLARPEGRSRAAAIPPRSDWYPQAARTGKHEGLNKGFAEKDDDL
jgi:hypothetical protein